jgi:MFS family permease
MYLAMMLLGGRAADLLGRRRMFLIWLFVFLIFSGLGGFANEGWVLILARFVTGVAAAFMTPAGLSIITTSIPEGPQRNKALLIYDAVLAPTLTPWLVKRFGNVRIIFGGFCLAAISYVLFLRIDIDWSYAAMFPTMILTGTAFALTYGPLTISATDGIAEEEARVSQRPAKYIVPVWRGTRSLVSYRR